MNAFFPNLYKCIKFMKYEGFSASIQHDNTPCCGLAFDLARLIARKVEIMMRLILSLTHYIILCNIRYGPERFDLRL